jgi:hypothetical protein
MQSSGGVWTRQLLVRVGLFSPPRNKHSTKLTERTEDATLRAANDSKIHSVHRIRHAVCGI